MRILQVITLSDLGGAQSVLVNLSNSLSENHNVAVVAGEGSGKLWDMLNDKIVKIHCNSLVRRVSPINDVKTICFFRKIFKDFYPDVIHLHSSKAGVLGRLGFPSSKIVYTVHGFDSIRLAHRFFLPVERLLQSRCKHIVGVSRYDYDALAQEGINHNLAVIPNGISIPKTTSKEITLPMLKDYRKRILCIARLSPQKNLELFLCLARKLNHYAFIWIGNQTEVENAPDNVFFLGSIMDAHIYNSIADLFILPSNYEGLPIVIIEAMSYGLPIIASDVGGIKEIVRNDINGYVLDNNVDSFADKISYIDRKSVL